MTCAEPISDCELSGLFEAQLKFPCALAVSGGPDSMALMHLVSRWIKNSFQPGKLIDGRDSVVVLTVDHRLRAESLDEARWVKSEAEKLGFSHVILSWEGEKPRSGLQAAAREARYRIIRDHLVKEVVVSGGGSGEHTSRVLRDVVTAHHEDDQAETVLMRLARGSGVDGLSGMAAVTTAYGLRIVRPLLSLPKSRLIATLRSAGVEWRDDPSNEMLAFERVRLRAARDELGRLGLTSEQLALSARRMARARQALSVATNALTSACALDMHGGAFASFDRVAFLKAPEELAVRMLMMVIRNMGGQSLPPRLSSIEDLCAELRSSPTYGATLGGCIAESKGQQCYVFREPGRQGLPELVLKRGQQGQWDRRFDFSFTPRHEGADKVRIAALGSDDLGAHRDTLDTRDWPRSALLTLPAVYMNGELSLVPHLGFVASSTRCSPYGSAGNPVAMTWRGVTESLDADE